MKKIITTAVLTLGLFIFCVAQENTGLYLFKKAEHGEAVVKMLNIELKLPDDQLAKVRSLISNNAKNQVELFKNPENNKPEMVKVIEARSTATIEGTLKSIIGLDKYNQYLQKKADIVKKVKLLEK